MNEESSRNHDYLIRDNEDSLMNSLGKNGFLNAENSNNMLINTNSNHIHDNQASLSIPQSFSTHQIYNQILGGSRKQLLQQQQQQFMHHHHLNHHHRRLHDDRDHENDDDAAGEDDDVEGQDQDDEVDHGDDDDDDRNNLNNHHHLKDSPPTILTESDAKHLSNNRFKKTQATTAYSSASTIPSYSRMPTGKKRFVSNERSIGLSNNSIAQNKHNQSLKHLQDEMNDIQAARVTTGAGTSAASAATTAAGGIRNKLTNNNQNSLFEDSTLDSLKEGTSSSLNILQPSQRGFVPNHHLSSSFNSIGQPRGLSNHSYQSFQSFAQNKQQGKSLSSLLQSSLNNNNNNNSSYARYDESSKNFFDSQHNISSLLNSKGLMQSQLNTNSMQSGNSLNFSNQFQKHASSSFNNYSQGKKNNNLMLGLNGNNEQSLNSFSLKQHPLQSSSQSQLQLRQQQQQQQQQSQQSQHSQHHRSQLMQQHSHHLHHHHHQSQQLDNLDRYYDPHSQMNLLHSGNNNNNLNSNINNNNNINSNINLGHHHALNQDDEQVAADLGFDLFPNDPLSHFWAGSTKVEDNGQAAGASSLNGIKSEELTVEGGLHQLYNQNKNLLGKNTFYPEKIQDKRQNDDEKDNADNSSRGLRNLSLKVKQIVVNKVQTSYKVVADILVDELRSQNTSYAKEEQKDEQNIKRRVYDALNVLIAANVIEKKGKVVKSCEKSHLNGRCLQTENWKNVKTIEARLQEKRQELKTKEEKLKQYAWKYAALMQLIARNKRTEENSVQSQASVDFLGNSQQLAQNQNLSQKLNNLRENVPLLHDRILIDTTDDTTEDAMKYPAHKFAFPLLVIQADSSDYAKIIVKMSRDQRNGRFYSQRKMRVSADLDILVQLDLQSKGGQSFARQCFDPDFPDDLFANAFKLTIEAEQREMIRLQLLQSQTLRSQSSQSKQQYQAPSRKSHSKK